jgi:hypothetical protein
VLNRGPGTQPRPFCSRRLRRSMATRTSYQEQPADHSDDDGYGDRFLIPLELDLLDGEIEPPDTPGQLASVVIGARRAARLTDPDSSRPTSCK